MKRHALPQGWRDRKISVDLIGVGGTGSQVLTGLARLHLALVSLGGQGLEVLVYDPDTVSEANIGRQLFAPSDIGQYKADVLVNRLNLYFGLSWESRPQRYEGGQNDHIHCHLLLTCVDSAKARRTIYSSLCKNYKADYWLDCGNARQSGQVFLTQMPRKNSQDLKQAPLPSLKHWLPEIFDEDLPEDNAPSCSLAEALENQDLFINQSVATWALHLLWSFIREGGLDICGYWISLENGMVAPVAIPEPKPLLPINRAGKAGSNG